MKQNISSDSEPAVWGRAAGPRPGSRRNGHVERKEWPMSESVQGLEVRVRAVAKALTKEEERATKLRLAGYSTKQIAGAMGQDEATVWRWLTRVQELLAAVDRAAEERAAASAPAPANIRCFSACSMVSPPRALPLSVGFSGFERRMEANRVSCQPQVGDLARWNGSGRVPLRPGLLWGRGEVSGQEGVRGRVGTPPSGARLPGRLCPPRSPGRSGPRS